MFNCVFSNCFTEFFFFLTVSFQSKLLFVVNQLNIKIIRVLKKVLCFFELIFPFFDSFGPLFAPPFRTVVPDCAVGRQDCREGPTGELKVIQYNIGK